jgi:hypothetical protein
LVQQPLEQNVAKKMQKEPTALASDEVQKEPPLVLQQPLEQNEAKKMPKGPTALLSDEVQKESAMVLPPTELASEEVVPTAMASDEVQESALASEEMVSTALASDKVLNDPSQKELVSAEEEFIAGESGTVVNMDSLVTVQEEPKNGSLTKSLVEKVSQNELLLYSETFRLTFLTGYCRRCFVNQHHQIA